MGKHRKAEPITSNELCVYGCGNTVKFKSPSGIMMCESSSTKCPINKQKNSSALKSAWQNHPDGFYDYKSLPKETRDRMAHSRGKTSDNYEPIARAQESRNESLKLGLWKPQRSGVAVDLKMRWKRNKFEYIDSFGNTCLLESWNELKLANELDKNGIKWIRPNPVKLSSGKTYEPDFYLVEHKVYLDPKAKFFGKSKYQGYIPGEDQLAKIEQFRNEYNVCVLVLWVHEKGSMKWENINARVAEWYTQRA